MVGDHLGNGGFQAMAVATGAHQHLDPTGDVHAHDGLFGGPATEGHCGGLDAHAETDAEITAAGLGLRAACGISTESAGRVRLKQSIELTLAIHALGCVTLIAAILIGK